MTKIFENNFTIDCTGDVCVGDTILFTEAVFSGGHRSPSYDGDRRIAAKVTKDSYGAKSQQHTFTLLVIASDGEEPVEPGATIRRKGRNVYRNGTRRMGWMDENQRGAALDEKHSRGRAARAARDARREFSGCFA